MTLSWKLDRGLLKRRWWKWKIWLRKELISPTLKVCKHRGWLLSTLQNSFFFLYNTEIQMTPYRSQEQGSGEQGWRSGESTRLPPLWPGFKSRRRTICGLSLLLVLSLAPRGFSPGTPVFPSPQKSAFPNSNSTRNQVDEESLCGCATCKSSFIYLFIYIEVKIFLRDFNDT